MSRPEMYGPNVQIAVRGDWFILQQKKCGVWVDMRLYDSINDEHAAADAREDAQRLASKCQCALGKCPCPELCNDFSACDAKLLASSVTRPNQSSEAK